MEKALYIKRQEMAAEIQRKLRAHETLTDEEITMVANALEDPLDEFCLREGTFRLVEILNVAPERANELAEDAAEHIRDVIDYNEQLYDDMDYELRYNVLEEDGEEDEEED